LAFVSAVAAALAAIGRLSGISMPSIDISGYVIKNAIVGQIYGGQDFDQAAFQSVYGASGLVIPPNAPFAAVLGDQSSGRNIEAPESLIRQIVAEEIGKSGGGGNGNITIKFAGSGAELVRLLKPQIDKENTRIGQA